jgi:hypothetical protein
MKWYSAKTVFRTTCFNIPKSQDIFFRDDIDLVEERIVLMRALSEDAAIKKAEKDAKEYEYEYENSYGQIVKTKYMESLDIIELYDEPEDLIEVYSSTRIYPRSLENEAIIDQILGPVENESDRRSRKIFSNTNLI